MGNRITHAAPHLSAQEVRERMQKEARLWCRRRWQIVYEALTAPRQAEEIARAVGVSLTTVHHVMAHYKREGVAAIETPGKGGRRHGYLTLEQECTFLQPFLARIAHGEQVTVAEIQQVYEEQVGQAVAPSTITRLLQRHGWRRHATSSRPAPVSEPSSTQRESTVVHAPKEPKSRTKEKRERAKQRSQSYPSDISDEEWAILEPLIPKALPGGHPRTTDMLEVINALFYIDRTGCQWRALPHDFPPWSTVWSYFRRWRNDGTWQRIHTALREQVRVKQGRQPTPSAAIIDSQSVKTSQKGGFAAMTAVNR